MLISGGSSTGQSFRASFCFLKYPVSYPARIFLIINIVECFNPVDYYYYWIFGQPFR